MGVDRRLGVPRNGVADRRGQDGVREGVYTTRREAERRRSQMGRVGGRRRRRIFGGVAGQHGWDEARGVCGKIKRARHEGDGGTGLGGEREVDGWKDAHRMHEPGHGTTRTDEGKKGRRGHAR